MPLGTSRVDVAGAFCLRMLCVLKAWCTMADMAKWYMDDQVAQLVQHETTMNLARETFGPPPKPCRAPNCAGRSPLT
eukprot:14547992-Alexandrium_andersonii.AAC.1